MSDYNSFKNLKQQSERERERVGRRESIVIAISVLSVYLSCLSGRRKFRVREGGGGGV